MGYELLMEPSYGVLVCLILIKLTLGHQGYLQTGLIEDTA
jgi:hypothetical protein